MNNMNDIAANNVASLLHIKMETLQGLQEKHPNIFKEVSNSKNILIHAPGGTGKTYLIKRIAEYCINNGKAVACMAPTGIAALGLSSKPEELLGLGDKKISGSTIHRWGGIPPSNEDSIEKIIQNILKNKRTKANWLLTDTIIIDEISMTGASMLERLNSIGQRMRKSTVPFGGIQLIVCGDFLQLPPIKDRWAFKSYAWKDLNLVPFSLYEPQRYPDQMWFELLLRVRKGRQTEKDIEFLKTRVDAYEKWYEEMAAVKDDTIVKPTTLYSRRNDVDLENQVELKKLKSKEEYTYVAEDTFVKYDNRSYAKKDAYEKNIDDTIPKVITLRVGAQVMLRANLDVNAGYVNGSRGVVIELNAVMVTVKWYNGTTTQLSNYVWTQEDSEGKMSRSQMPLILAWAMTIHKSQGCTLDYVICNLGPTVFSPGQAYVALSRVRSSEGLLLEDFYPEVIIVDEEALKYVQSIESQEAVCFQTVGKKGLDQAKTTKYKGAAMVDTSEIIYTKLMEWRDNTAKRLDIEPYYITTISTIKDLSYYKPSTMQELYKIRGMGDISIGLYGEDILTLILEPM